MGIPAFSTLAPLDAQTQLTRIVSEQRDAAQRALAKAYIADLTLDPRQLAALLNDGREGRIAALAMLVKPPFWRNLPLAFAKYTLIAAHSRPQIPS